MRSWNLAWIPDHFRGQIVRHHSDGGLTRREDHDTLCSNICIEQRDVVLIEWIAITTAFSMDGQRGGTPLAATGCQAMVT